MEALILDQHDTQNPPVFKTILLWAFVMTVFNMLTGTADYFFPVIKQHNIISGAVTITGIMLLMLAAGYYHRKHYAGRISYLQAFCVSFFSAVLALLIAGSLMYLFWIYFADFDAYMQADFDAVYESYKNQGYDAVTIERSMQGVKKLYTPLKLCIFATLGGLIVDIPLALLVSIFIKRKIKT